MSAVATEAIRSHPREFATGIVHTTWALLRARAIASPVATAGAAQADENTDDADTADGPFVVINGRKLPAPSEGQPIPASHFGPIINTLHGRAREVWRSATEHAFVFADARDERRYESFQQETARLGSRIPTREANESLVSALNQASRFFPPPVFWLVVGSVAIAIRRPRRALVAIAPAIAGLVVITGTALVAFGVAEYALPLSPAFVALAAAGLVGAEPQRPLRRSRPR